MRRHETLLALLAVILASVAALQVPGRLLFAIAAVVLLAFVGISRVRGSLTQKRERPTFDSYERAARIREERENRRGPGP